MNLFAQSLRGRSSILFCVCYFILLGETIGQVVFPSDEFWPQRYESSFRPLPSFLRSSTPDTLSISASNPFFDDFAYPDQSPDSNRWFVPAALFDVPIITRHLAVEPPSRGAVSFDGNNRQGIPYNPGNVGNGTADRLFSHYLDLSGYDVSDQLLLSFFLQPQGRGEKPESADSFFVYFRTPNPPPNEFQKVFAIGGGPLREFEQYVIPINNPSFFHTGFQLLFESQGSQNGSLDEWHLDYVYLAPNRSLNDTTYQDQSPIAVLQSPMAPYTALPVQHYQALMNPMADVDISVHNLAGVGKTVTLEAELSDPVAQTPMTPPFSRQSSVSLPAMGNTEKSLNAFGKQSFDKLAALEMTVSISGGGDQNPDNNSFSERYPIDSVLAYDDGERDTGFGLNQALGFGTKVTLPQADSVAAVWISFQPSIHFNPVTGAVTFLQNQTFRLVIWNQPHPDSTIAVQLSGMKVNYGERPHEFVRYAFSSPVPVPQTFWVGVQQVDSKSLGVGYDLTYNNDDLTYYDSLGNWVNARFGGTLMIRPEMVNTFSVPASNEEQIGQSTRAQLFPNPLFGTQIQIEVDPVHLGEMYQFQILDLQGKMVWESLEARVLSSSQSFELGKKLVPGVYLVRHIFQGGEREVQVEKLLVH